MGTSSTCGRAKSLLPVLAITVKCGGTTGEAGILEAAQHQDTRADCRCRNCSGACQCTCEGEVTGEHRQVAAVAGHQPQRGCLHRAGSLVSRLMCQWKRNCCMHIYEHGAHHHNVDQYQIILLCVTANMHACFCALESSA